MQGLIIFGSTGSIGTSALSLLSNFSDTYKIIGLSAKGKIQKLKEQAETFKVPYLVVEREEDAQWLKENLSYKAEVLIGDRGLKELAESPEAKVVLIGISGLKALIPTYYALKSGKRVALANKECLVSAGALLKKVAKEYGGEIIPVDSEHSALFQLLKCEKQNYLRKLVLTASGGPFLDWDPKYFEKITPEMALHHPTWKMGPKITVDSALLMNKGFEVIEAMELFEIPPSSIEVIIHPQSIIHSLIEFIDGTILAHMGLPDMKIPIAYALSYPERWELPFAYLDLKKLRELTFREVDFTKFPCLKLAYLCAEKGFPYPLILEAGDEVVVSAFLNQEISFSQIPYFLEKIINEFKFEKKELSTLEDILTLYYEVCALAEGLIKKKGKS